MWGTWIFIEILSHLRSLLDKMSSGTVKPMELDAKKMQAAYHDCTTETGRTGQHGVLIAVTQLL